MLMNKQIRPNVFLHVCHKQLGCIAHKGQEKKHKSDLKAELSEGFIFALMTQESKVITLVGEVTVAQNGIVRGFELTYLKSVNSSELSARTPDGEIVLNQSVKEWDNTQEHCIVQLLSPQSVTIKIWYFCPFFPVSFSQVIV